MSKLKFVILIFLICFGVLSVSTQKAEKDKFKQTTWKINNLKKIGGRRVTVLGEPQIVKTDQGKAVSFDGIDDGIFIDANPIAGAKKFTIEAVFRPEAGGGKEQRWFHIEDAENIESRALMEIRLNENEWFLDTFLKSGENRLPLYAENFKHPVGQWFHVALVFDGREMRHYVNGRLELSGKISIKPFGKGLTSIGVRQNKVFWFKGAVRKARFTNRALSLAAFMK